MWEACGKSEADQHGCEQEIPSGLLMPLCLWEGIWASPPALAQA